MSEVKTGLELIAEERKRQIEVEGYTAEHDEQHGAGELARAAAYYACPIKTVTLACAVTVDLNLLLFPSGWSGCFAKKGPDVKRNLAKAGALIAAELDRLNRLEARSTGEPCIPVSAVKRETTPILDKINKTGPVMVGAVEVDLEVDTEALAEAVAKTAADVIEKLR